MKKGIIMAAGVAVVLAAVVVLPKVLRSKTVVEEAPVPVVEVQKPELGSIELYRNLVGTVEPSDVVYIYPKMAGEVTDVFVKAGDMVQEGQDICRIDTKQVDAARLSLEGAQVALNNANTNLARQQALFAAGDISSAAFEQAQSQADSARIQYDTAKLNYDNQMEFSNITASIAGKVEICDIEVHDNVSQQMLICVISGEGSKAVSFSVTEKVVDQLHVGDPVVIEKNGEEYHGSITEVSSMIDASTGLFKVKSSVDSGDALPTGSAVKLYVTSDKTENAMTLPVDAVYYSGGDAYVYTYDNGIVHRVAVEEGIYDSERIEILSGLNMEDEVITTWSSELFEGSRVQKAPSAEEQGAEIPASDAETQAAGDTAQAEAE